MTQERTSYPCFDRNFFSVHLLIVQLEGHYLPLRTPIMCLVYLRPFVIPSTLISIGIDTLIDVQDSIYYDFQQINKKLLFVMGTYLEPTSKYSRNPQLHTTPIRLTRLSSKPPTVGVVELV